MIFTEWVHFDLATLGSLEWLSESERAQVSRLYVPQRRAAWLAGRLAAKKAAARCLREFYGVHRALCGIEIVTSAWGAPRLFVKEFPKAAQLPISIAHKAPWAAAAAGAEGCCGIGIDFETVSERGKAWTEMAFHPREEVYESADPWIQTKAWTVKEAVLKALGLGLNVDLYEVRLKRGMVTLVGRCRRRLKDLGGRKVECRSWPRENMAVSMAVLR